MFSRSKGVIIIETRQDAVCDLLDNKLLVGFTLFSLPKNAIRMPFHVLDILPCPVVLFVGKRDGEAGFYVMCLHSE